MTSQEKAVLARLESGLGAKTTEETDMERLHYRVVMGVSTIIAAYLIFRFARDVLIAPKAGKAVKYGTDAAFGVAAVVFVYVLMRPAQRP